MTREERLDGRPVPDEVVVHDEHRPRTPAYSCSNSSRTVRVLVRVFAEELYDVAESQENGTPGILMASRCTVATREAQIGGGTLVMSARRRLRTAVRMPASRSKQALR